MNNLSLLHLLSQYEINAPSEENRLVQELKKLVASDPHCFERKKKENAKHIAASILLLTPDFQRALFLWHTKIQRWTQPGGHADGDSNLHRVALKELEEETGVAGAALVSPTPLDVYRFDYPAEIFDYKKSIYNVCFVALLPKNQKPRIVESDKCEKMVWATPAEAMEMIEEVPHIRTKELICKWQALADMLAQKKKRPTRDVGLI